MSPTVRRSDVKVKLGQASWSRAARVPAIRYEHPDPFLACQCRARARRPAIGGCALAGPHSRRGGLGCVFWRSPKTDREIYRWIANTHYEHLAPAVLHLKRVHAAGCTFGSLLTIRNREQFLSLTAEVLVADDLLRRGCTVRDDRALGSSEPGPPRRCQPESMSRWRSTALENSVPPRRGSRR